MAHVAPLNAVVRPTRRAGHGRHISVLSRYTARRRIGTIARHDHHHIDVTIPGSNRDPRSDAAALASIRIHRSPSLHPDDVVTLPSGLRVTSVSRTLIDLAEELTADELREIVIFLTHYAGWPLGARMNSQVEELIAKAARAEAKAEEG